MRERGAASVMALWVLLAASALSYAALSAARQRRLTAEARLAFVRLPVLIHAAAVEASRAGFTPAERVHEFPTGRVETRRETLADGALRLWCVAQSRGYEVKALVRFERLGAGWRAVSWTETW